jgi:hypothetical protein
MRFTRYTPSWLALVREVLDLLAVDARFHGHACLGTMSRGVRRVDAVDINSS